MSPTAGRRRARRPRCRPAPAPVPGASAPPGSGCPGSFDVADSRYAGIGSSARTSPNNAEPTASRAVHGIRCAPQGSDIQGVVQHAGVPVDRGQSRRARGARRCARSRDPAMARARAHACMPACPQSARPARRRARRATAAAPGSSERPAAAGYRRSGVLGLRRRQQDDHERKGYR